MGKIKKHQPVKLIAGLIFQHKAVLKKTEGLLTNRLGPSDFESRIVPFIHTRYYEKEFGPNLLRKFIAFKKLIPPEDLPRIKILSNSIEKKISQTNRRKVNIDPGYLDLSKLILATTKDFSHRIYLNKGIFAEVTLVFRDKTYQPREWTYPDYSTQEYINIFNQIREIYRKQLEPT